MPSLDPPAPALTGWVGKFILTGELFGQTIQNVFYYAGMLGTEPPISVTAFKTWFDINILPDWQSCVSTDYTFKSWKLVHLTLPTAIPEYVNYAPGVTGGVATDADAPQVAVDIQRKTDLIGRHGRGRIEIAGIAEADTAAGKLTAGSLALFQTLAASLNLVLVVAGNSYVTMVVYYKKLTPLTFDVRGRPVVNWVVDEVLGTQRRRKVGRGI